MRLYGNFFCIIAIVAAAGAAFAGQPGLASPEDLGKLQTDLTYLEADLTAAKDLPSELVHRVETIREEAIYLKVKIRKHEESEGQDPSVTRDEVRDLRLEIADLRNEVAPYVTRPEGVTSVTLRAGTEIALRLEETLSSRTAQPGDRFTAVAAEPLLEGNLVAIEAGDVFSGRVEVVDQAEGRTDRKAELVLAVNQLERRGKTHSVDATVVRASERLETGVGSEMKKIGIGAGLGGVLGAVLGGKKGAAIGAAVGGGGSVLATEGNEVELPRGTILYIELDRDLTLPLD